MDNGRDRNSFRDRYRDKIRDVESDRSRRYYKYDDYEYGNRDRRYGYDEVEYCRDRDRKCNLGKNRGLKDDFLKENVDGLNRYYCSFDCFCLYVCFFFFEVGIFFFFKLLLMC